MKWLKDIFETYKKFKPVFILTICSLFLFLSTLWNPLIYVLYVITFLFYLTCNFGEFLCYTMYFEMFSGILPYFLVSVCIGFVINIGRYVYELIKKKTKFYLIPFVLTIALIVIFSLIHYEVDQGGVEQGILFDMLLLGVYIAFVYRKEINVKKCFEFLSLGIIVSLLFSLLFYAIPSCHSLVCYRNQFVNMSLKDYIFTSDGLNSRLQLLTYHTNHLGIICIFMLSYLLYAILTFKNKTKWTYAYYLAIFLISTVLGFLTLSKAFMLVFAILIIYAIICSIIKFKKKSVFIIIPLVICFIIFGVIFKDKIIEIFKRFTMYQGSILNALTTGRSTIWKEYFQSIGSSFATIVFGHGFFTKNVVAIGSHNILIELLYRLGIFGVLMLIGLIISYYFASDKKLRFTYKNCVLLIAFIIYGLEEMILSERFIFFLILGLIMMVDENKTLKKNTNQVEESEKALSNKQQSDNEQIANELLSENNKN